MILEKTGYSYNDLTIVPAKITNINSRSDCNPYYGDMLPIFTAPMSSVVNVTNLELFINSGITPIVPRNIDYNIRKSLALQGYWIALSLNEFKDMCINNMNEFAEECCSVCIDVANGHMNLVYEYCESAKKIAKQYNCQLKIMVGNIANPETIRILNEYNKNELIVDYIRCGIGGGSGCITSSNTAVHYPMASLIEECSKYAISKRDRIKIIADGGIRNYSDVIKALGLGADYVMIGSVLSGCVESAAEKSIIDYSGNRVTLNNNQEAMTLYNKGIQIYSKFYGMASAQGQIDIQGKKTKTSEGIMKYIPVNNTLYKWSENMADYLRSAMSYCNCRYLDEFIGKCDFIINSNNAINAVNK